MWPAGRVVGLELTAGRCSGLVSACSAALSSASGLQQFQSQALPEVDAFSMHGAHGFASAAVPQPAKASSSSSSQAASKPSSSLGTTATAQPPMQTGTRFRGGPRNFEGQRQRVVGSAAQQSLEMSRFEEKLDKLEKDGFLVEAVDAFEMMMKEAFEAAQAQAQAETGGKQLPLQYRPRQRMVDYHLRRLRMIYVPPVDQRAGGFGQRPPLRIDSRTAQEFMKKVLFAGQVCEGAGLRKPSLYYEGLMRAYQLQRNTPMVLQTYEEAKASGGQISFQLMQSAYYAVLNDKNYSGTALQRLQAAHKLVQDMIRSVALRGPAEDLLINRALNTLLRTAVRRHEWNLVTELRLDLQKAGFTMDTDIHLEYLYHVALDNDVTMVEQRLGALDRLSLPILALPGPYKAAIKVPPGTKPGSGSVPVKLPEAVLLEVMYCARRNSRPQLAQRAFNLISSSLQRSTYFPPDYYKAVQPVEDPRTLNEKPPPALPQFSIPSRAAHHALIHTLVEAKQWAEAWKAIALLEERFAATKPSTVSPYHGLSYFARALVNVQDLNGALTALTERMEAVIPASTEAAAQSGSGSSSSDSNAEGGASSPAPSTSSRPLGFITPISILMRGTALRGAMDDTNKLFRFMQKFGERPNSDVYTAVLETAVVAKKLSLVPKTLDYIRSPAALGAPPGPEAYDILLRGYIDAQDCDEFLGALSLLLRDDVKPRVQTLQAALKMAVAKQHTHAITRITTSLLDVDEQLKGL